jgi:hypothetical protein
METKSFYAKYHSTDGKTLIGGVIKSQTSRFDSRPDAFQRLDQILEINGNHCTGEVVESSEYPEIFLHCGRYSQAIGGKCPSCGKILTIQDAKETSPRY